MKADRIGVAFQAKIPAQIGSRPAPGNYEDDPHASLPGPSEEEALESARGKELSDARALPRDATTDPPGKSTALAQLWTCLSSPDLLQQPELCCF